MKVILHTVQFCLFACCCCFATAQSFDISIQPPLQSVTVGETAVYTIHIQPSGGFQATVFLSAQTTLTYVFSQAAVNDPYADVTLSVKAGLQDTGTKTITIRGVNGKVERTLTCTVQVARNTQWSRVSSPLQGSIGSLRLDRNGLPMMISTGGDNRNSSPFIFVHRFSNKHWSTDSIQTNFSSSFFHYTSADGIDDRDGTMWIAVGEGLLKYDGQFVTYYTTSNSDLGMNYVRNVYRDRDGNIVCMGSDDIDNQFLHLARRINNQWIHLHPTLPLDAHSGHINAYWMTGVCADSSDHLWIGTQGAGAVRISADGSQSFFNSQNSGLKSNTVYRIDCDANGTLSFLHPYGSGIPIHTSRFTGTTWDFIASPYFNNSIIPSGLLIAPDHSTWSSSNFGLHHIVGTSQYTNYHRDNSPLSSNDVRLQVQDKDGNFWMLTGYDNYYSVFNPNGLVGIPLQQSTDVPVVSLSPESLSVVPNPASHLVDILSSDKAGCVVRLYSSDGRLCAQSTCDDRGVYRVETDALPSGIYRCCTVWSSVQLVVIH